MLTLGNDRDVDTKSSKLTVPVSVQRPHGEMFGGGFRICCQRLRRQTLQHVRKVRAGGVCVYRYRVQQAHEMETIWS
jgi:hypothetical protein